jgi:hypothetical protein
MTTKQSFVMRRGVTSSAFTEWFQNDFTYPDYPRRLVIPRCDWGDMGGPEVITVTIEPGDLLNDEPA